MRIEQNVRSIKDKKKDTIKKDIVNFIYDDDFNKEEFKNKNKINEEINISDE